MTDSIDFLFRVRFPKSLAKNVAVDANTKILGGELIAVDFDASYSDWRCFEKEKPPENKAVLVFGCCKFLGDDEIMVAHREGDCMFLADSSELQSVTHWRFLPMEP